MPLTSAITEAVHKKTASLEKFIHTNAFVQVELGKPSSHHKSGNDIFATEITVDMKGHTYYVQVTDADLYTSLDRATADIIEMIKHGKGRRQTLARRGRIAIKNLLKKGF
jgi:ribosomal subunit interface protein